MSQKRTFVESLRWPWTGHVDEQLTAASQMEQLSLLVSAPLCFICFPMVLFGCTGAFEINWKSMTKHLALVFFHSAMRRWVLSKLSIIQLQQPFIHAACLLHPSGNFCEGHVRAAIANPTLIPTAACSRFREGHPLQSSTSKEFLSWGTSCCVRCSSIWRGCSYSTSHWHFLGWNQEGPHALAHQIGPECSSSGAKEDHSRNRLAEGAPSLHDRCAGCQLLVLLIFAEFIWWKIIFLFHRQSFPLSEQSFAGWPRWHPLDCVQVSQVSGLDSTVFEHFANWNSTEGYLYLQLLHKKSFHHTFHLCPFCLAEPPIQIDCFSMARGSRNCKGSKLLRLGRSAMFDPLCEKVLRGHYVGCKARVFASSSLWLEHSRMARRSFRSYVWDVYELVKRMLQNSCWPTLTFYIVCGVYGLNMQPLTDLRQMAWKSQRNTRVPGAAAWKSHWCMQQQAFPSLLLLLCIFSMFHMHSVQCTVSLYRLCFWRCSW